MAQTGFTPISNYYSTTASAVPTAANLVPGELAINTNDGKLYYEDSSGVVQVLATKSTGSIGGSNTQVQFNNSGSLGGSSGLTWDGSFLTTSSIKNSALTSGRVTYAGASGLLSDSANLTFDGTNFTNGSITSSITVAKVSVSGTGIGYLGVDSYTVNGIYLINNNTGTTTTGVTTATLGLMGTGAYPLVLGTNSTERMRITSAGNVGIGTSNPSSPLTVSTTGVNSTVQINSTDGAGGYGAVLSLNNTGTGGREYYISSTSNADGGVGGGKLKFYDLTTNTTRMLIDASGNLGLGVTPVNLLLSFGYKNLELPKAAFYSFAISSSRSIMGLKSNIYYDASANALYVGNGYGTQYQTDLGEHAWYNAPNNTSGAGASATLTQAMTLTASGQLLVGDTTGNGVISARSATAALMEVKTTTGTNYAALEVVNTGGSMYIGRDNSAGNFFGAGTGYASCLYSSGAYPMAFFTNGTERMRITSAGELLIGATSNATPSGSTSFVVAQSNFRSGSTYGMGMSFNSTGATGADHYYISFNTATTTQRGYIYYNDSTGTVLLNATSDVRLKKNIVNAPNVLELVNQVKVRQYDWKDTGNTNIGFVAQELHEIIPRAVSVGQDNEDGSIKRAWGVDNATLVPYLVKAIQEQQALIESLTTRLTALENK